MRGSFGRVRLGDEGPVDGSGEVVVGVDRWSADGPGAALLPAWGRGRTAMATIGLVRSPVGWPASTASPEGARDPSAPTAQYPLPDGVGAMAATGRNPEAEARAAASPNG